MATNFRKNRAPSPIFATQSGKILTENLKKAARDGAFWTAASQIGAGLCQWAQLFWLARLLPASDFGVMAIAQASVGILAPMTDLGLSQAIIQQKHIEDRQLNTLFWLNMAIGVSFFLTFLAVGWGAARFYGQPVLWPLMAAVAVIFLLYPLAAQPSAMLTRALDFRSLAVADVVSWAFSLFFAVFLAKNGWGVFALGTAHIIRYFVATVLSWCLAREICPVPGRDFDWPTSRFLVRFGLYDSAARWLNILQLNADKFIVGKWLGMAELGYYSLAWSVVQAPITRVLPIISKVTAPIFSKIQHQNSAKLSSGYTKTMALVFAISLPIFLGISLISNELIIIFFGHKWVSAAPVLAILAFVGLVRSLGSPGANLLLARGRPEPNLWWNILFTTCTVIWTIGWMYFLPTAIGAAWAQLTCILSIGWVWHWAIWRFGQVSYRGILRPIFRMLFWAAPAAVLCLFVEKMGWPLLPNFVIKSTFFAVFALFLLKKHAPTGFFKLKKQTN